MKSIQQLREQRQAKAKEVRALLDSNPGDQWNDELQATYDAAIVEIDALDAEINRIQAVIDREATGQQVIQDRADREGISTDEASHRATTESGIFSAWMRGGTENLNDDQRAYVAERRREARAVMGAMSVGTDSEGGYLAPDDFGGRLLSELLAFGGVRALAQVISTDGGNTIEWPTVDDTAEEGEILAENATATRGEMTFGVKSIGAFKYSSKDIAIPFELLQDQRVDLEAFLLEALRTRLGRGTNRHYTVGNGTTQPEGVVTAAAVGRTGASGQTDSVIWDDLIDLEHSVDIAYRMGPNVGYMFHDTTLAALKKIKDGQGRPLWVPGVATSEPNTINGHRYSVNNHMAEMAASARSILFGDFSKYLIRDCMQVTLFRMTDSAFTRNGQVGFLAFMRTDGRLIASSNSCIKAYVNAAS